MRSIKVKRILKNGRAGSYSFEHEDLKGLVRDRLLEMTRDEQKDFIQAFESEMQRVNRSICQYLIPLGISAAGFDELTPTETGHLIRFLKINVPAALPAVENVLARFEISAEKQHDPGHILAA